MPAGRNILLSFDIEEFDLPQEYGQVMPVAAQLDAGFRGLQEIENVLDQSYVYATLFTTAFFASNHIVAIRQLSHKHEIASHCFFHSSYTCDDLLFSKETLQEITGKKVFGLRMPRMRKIDPGEVLKAGYQYNSSINPTWLPGRYNNLHIPRLPFREDNLLQFPVSVTPRMRIPLFWLTFRNIPYSLYLRLVLEVLRHDNYVCLYFHPWEFIDLSGFKIPFYIKRSKPRNMLAKLKKLVKDLSGEGNFITMHQYIEEIMQDDRHKTELVFNGK